MESIEYKGYTINIKYDEIAENPRNWDNLGNMLCWHKRYSLGDENLKDDFSYMAECKLENLPKYCNSWEEIKNILKKEFKAFIIMPLYLYDHSGISMRTYRHGIHSSWDCGSVGFIYITKEKIYKEYNVKRITKKLKEQIENYLINEVEIYSNWLEGNIYFYNIENKNGEYINSCGGFYGYDFEENGLLDEAKSFIDYNIREERKQKAEKLKSFIKNKVSLIYR